MAAGGKEGDCAFGLFTHRNSGQWLVVSGRKIQTGGFL